MGSKTKNKNQPDNVRRDTKTGKYWLNTHIPHKMLQKFSLTILITVSIVLLFNVIRSKGNINFDTGTVIKDSRLHDKPESVAQNAAKGEIQKIIQSSGSSKEQSNLKSSLDPFKYSAAKKYKEETQDQCFCQLKGHVDDCSCSVDTVDHFNNMKIFPRLKSLLSKDYFRYFQYNPHKPCLHWNKSSGTEPPEKCTSPTCGVKSCTPEELPPGLKGESPTIKEENCGSDNAAENQTENDKVDDTISDSAKLDINSWKIHDEKVKGFCEVDDANDPECIHVDLTINPERYTGYSGEASRKVWRAIYQENCFRPPNSTNSSGVTKPNKKARGKNKLTEIFGVPQERLGELCLEKRAFYRAISGLHSSITIHLSSRFPEGKLRNAKTPNLKGFFPEGAGNNSPFSGLTEENYVPNVELFLSRFDPERTNGQGPFWLKNLYFVYLLELRALQKAATYLESRPFYTGNEEEDKDTQIAVKEFMHIVRTFPEPLDESKLFSSSETSDQLKTEFREHFRNVTKIMDCVSCDKCKLWGKLQTNGLGTALKILFSDDKKPNELNESESDDTEYLKLNRNEVVSLFNAFGRISTSIQQLELFREMLRDDIS